MILVAASYGLASNPGFETGSAGLWSCAGPSSLYASSTSKYSGSFGGVLYTQLSTVGVHAIYQNNIGPIYVNQHYLVTLYETANLSYIPYEIRLYNVTYSGTLIKTVGSFYTSLSWVNHTFVTHITSLPGATLSWKAPVCLAIEVRSQNMLPTLYCDDINITPAVVIDPSYESKIFEISPNMCWVKNAGGQFVSFNIGSVYYRRYHIYCDMVTAAQKALITSWWISGLDLRLWPIDTDSTLVSSLGDPEVVRIVSETEPFIERRLDRRGYFCGELILETIGNV